MSSLSPATRILPLLRGTLQVLALALVWMLADALSHRYIPLLPASVLGMFIVLALLGSGLLPRHRLAQGAGWLLGEMLLFFVPSVISIVQYPELIWKYGLAILGVIVLSTACVMATTALAVEAVFRLRRKGREPS